MSSVRFAARYAKSLLDIAKEKDLVDAVKIDIELIAKTLHTNRDLKVALKSPVIPSDKKSTVLAQVFDKGVTEITARFLKLLSDKGRAGYLPEVAESFITQYNVLKGITKVSLTTATAMDEATRDTIINGLKQKENLANIELTQDIDTSLVGGFLLRYAGKQIDTSIKTSLGALKVLVDDDSYVKKYS
jgi:F-type H+-transporting ATPase subunit delta